MYFSHIRFGPLRHQWCMRLEGKNAYIKGLVGKNFKNLAYSIAQRHQNYMCLHLLSAPGVKSTNFLYKGDEVQNGCLKINVITKLLSIVYSNAFVCSFYSLSYTL